MQGVITQVSSTGAIVLAEVISPGFGYDWTLVHISTLTTNSSTCLCDGVCSLLSPPSQATSYEALIIRNRAPSGLVKEY